MSQAASAPAGRRTVWKGPLHGVVVALGGAALAAVVRQVGISFLTGACLPLVIAAALTAGWAVRRSLQRFQEDLDTRLETATILALTSLVPLLGYWAMAPSWDSGRMVLVALLAVAVAGALLVLLPRTARLSVISVLILLHFGGILTAVLSVDPPGQNAPWLANRAWTCFYRPYLGFMYLNNAYHFYSPEPGPPTLIWCSVIYRKGDQYQYQWIKFPDRETSPVPLHHQRLLALSESTNQINQVLTDALFQQRLAARNEAKDMPLQPPLHPGWPTNRQLAIPSPYSQEMLKAIARHMARLHLELEDDPEYKFYSIKIYRVVHYILTAHDLASGCNPLDKTYYLPFYQGDFDARGDLRDANDPLLYWLIPIYRAGAPLGKAPNPNEPAGHLFDYLEEHARLVK